MKKKIRFLISLFPYFLISHSFAQDTTALRYSKNITAADLSIYLHQLASDEFEGRETGQKGQKLAAQFIAKHFSDIGIPAYKNDSYFQEIPLVIKNPDGVSISANNSNYEFLNDFYYFPGFDDTVISRDKIVFVGYGINSEKYNDYANLIVQNKIIMFLSGEPMNKKGISYLTKTKEISDWTTPNSRQKNTLAKDLHPSAVLIVTDSLTENLNKFFPKRKKEFQYKSLQSPISKFPLPKSHHVNSY